MTKEEALEILKELHDKAPLFEKGALETLIPGLKGSEREEDIVSWLEKQGKCETDCPQNHQDVNHPNGCITMEDFSGGEGFYKLNIEYLNKRQVEEIEEIVRTWNKDADCGLCTSKEHCISIEKQDEMDIEKPITIGKRRAVSGKLKDLFDNKDAKSIEETKKKMLKETGPKFKVGDWIINRTNATIAQIIAVTDSFYDYREQSGQRSMSYQEYVEWDFRLWSIADAKPGDVLACCDNKPFIFKGFFDLNFPNCLAAYCGVTLENQFGHCNGKTFWTNQDVKPATKEQCNLLFQKMHEAGYEWDADKKELKKTPNALEECEIERIEHGKYYYCIKDYYYAGKKEVSKGDVVQALKGMTIMALGVKANEYFIPVKSIVDNKPEDDRPAWSEEDENNLRDSIVIIDRYRMETQYADIKKVCKHCIDWLKSIKDRVQPQPKQDGKWKWEEDDEKFFKENILVGLGNADNVSEELYNKIIDWLNLIKKRLS